MKSKKARRGDRPKLWVPPRFQAPMILHLVRTTANQPGPLSQLIVGPPAQGRAVRSEAH